MANRLPRSGLAVLGVLLMVAATAAASDGTEEPLTVEQVVRLHVAGASADELVRMILTRPADYELSADMVDELRAAGLPPEVIDAMHSRQNQMLNDAPGQTASGAEGPSNLVVRLNSRQTRDSRRYIRVQDRVDLDLAAEWELGNSPEERRFADVALFVACRRADHVPDQWRSKTPLRWDSEIMPRHEMLAFAPGARWTEAGFLQAFGFAPSRVGEPVAFEDRVEPGVLVLQIPPTLEAAVDPRDTHDLVVGIAVQVGESYYPWSISALDDVRVDSRTVELEATIRGTDSSRLESIAIAIRSENAGEVKALVARGCCLKSRVTSPAH